MRDYWNGLMNWSINSDWKCETCKERHPLTWGMVHAQCRCNKCHTQYWMRDEEGQVVTIPICQLRDEYKEPFRLAYLSLNRPVEEITMSELKKFMKEKIDAS